MFAGVPLGTYGEYKKSSKFGALNIKDKNMRRALWSKASTRSLQVLKKQFTTIQPNKTG